MRFAHAVGEAIARHRLWASGDRVAVAVSGGVDSVVLLHALVRTAGWHGGVLSVVTVDHGLRPEAAAEADLVEGLAARLGLPCTRLVLELGAASQDAARRARYAAFDALDVDRVALGHHRDDQAETVLINLLRGTSPIGLEGMPWRRGRYVRPLLDVSRADIEAWARDQGLEWRQDPTSSLRTRIREEILRLEAIRPGARQTLARSATLAAEQGAFLDSLIPDDPWTVAFVADGPEPLVRRFLHRCVPGLRSAHADAVIEAARRGSGAVALPEGELAIDGGRLHLRR